MSRTINVNSQTSNGGGIAGSPVVNTTQGLGVYINAIHSDFQQISAKLLALDQNLQKFADNGNAALSSPLQPQWAKHYQQFKAMLDVSRDDTVKTSVFRFLEQCSDTVLSGATFEDVTAFQADLEASIKTAEVRFQEIYDSDIEQKFKTLAKNLRLLAAPIEAALKNAGSSLEVAQKDTRKDIKRLKLKLIFRVIKTHLLIPVPLVISVLVLHPLAMAGVTLAAAGNVLSDGLTTIAEMIQGGRKALVLTTQRKSKKAELNDLKEREDILERSLRSLRQVQTEIHTLADKIDALSTIWQATSLERNMPILNDVLKLLEMGRQSGMKTSVVKVLKQYSDVVLLVGVTLENIPAFQADLEALKARVEIKFQEGHSSNIQHNFKTLTDDLLFFASIFQATLEKARSDLRSEQQDAENTFNQLGEELISVTLSTSFISMIFVADLVVGALAALVFSIFMPSPLAMKLIALAVGTAAAATIQGFTNGRHEALGLKSARQAKQELLTALKEREVLFEEPLDSLKQTQTDITILRSKIDALFPTWQAIQGNMQALNNHLSLASSGSATVGFQLQCCQSSAKPPPIQGRVSLQLEFVREQYAKIFQAIDAYGKGVCSF
ncbi:hypothetical protein VTO73DRAFT_10452 [Trametes versicolor]